MHRNVRLFFVLPKVNYILIPLSFCVRKNRLILGHCFERSIFVGVFSMKVIWACSGRFGNMGTCETL